MSETLISRCNLPDDMYGFSELAEAIRHPHYLYREFNRLYHTRFWSRPYNPDGVSVFEEDWDTLVILDACRYDIFAERVSLPGQLERRRSRGAATPEFIRANFDGRDLRDTVYVAHNNWFLKLRDELDTVVHAFYNEISESQQPLTERAIKAHKEHPNKRIIVHYLPPHHPFVGPTAAEHLPSYDDQSNDLFERIRTGEIDISDNLLRRTYAENLDRVVAEVEHLLEQIEGRTVVTSDHGELLGERCRPIPVREYGHHVGLYVPELVNIPWLVHESGERRVVTADEPIERQEIEEDVVNQRLRDLGYKPE